MHRRLLFFFVVVVCGLRVDAFQFLYPDLLHLQLSISSSPKPTGGSLGGVRQAKMEDQFFFLSLLTVSKRTHPPLLFPSVHPADAAAASAAVAAERRGGSNRSGESAVIGLCIDQ